MKHVGIFEAKTNLSALVEEVEKGGQVVITRHGKPVARLVPTEPGLSPEDVARKTRALRDIRAFANSLKINLTPEEIKASIEEGRR